MASSSSLRSCRVASQGALAAYERSAPPTGRRPRLRQLPLLRAPPAITENGRRAGTLFFGNALVRRVCCLHKGTRGSRKLQTCKAIFVFASSLWPAFPSNVFHYFIARLTLLWLRTFHLKPVGTQRFPPMFFPRYFARPRLSYRRPDPSRNRSSRNGFRSRSRGPRLSHRGRSLISLQSLPPRRRPSWARASGCRARAAGCRARRLGGAATGREAARGRGIGFGARRDRLLAVGARCSHKCSEACRGSGISSRALLRRRQARTGRKTSQRWL